MSGRNEQWGSLLKLEEALVAANDRHDAAVKALAPYEVALDALKAQYSYGAKKREFDDAVKGMAQAEDNVLFGKIQFVFGLINDAMHAYPDEADRMAEWLEMTFGVKFDADRNYGETEDFVEQVAYFAKRIDSDGFLKKHSPELVAPETHDVDEEVYYLTDRRVCNVGVEWSIIVELPVRVIKNLKDFWDAIEAETKVARQRWAGEVAANGLEDKAQRRALYEVLKAEFEGEEKDA